MKNIVFDIPKGFEVDAEKSNKDKIVLKYKKAQYIDLGLPSGNLWALENEEDYYTYDAAVKQFGNELPTIVDFAELVHYCKWEWDKRRKSIIVTGLNGNSIFIPAVGYRSVDSGALNTVGSYGCYWSASPAPSDSNIAYSLSFLDGTVYPALDNLRSNGYSVRCVKRTQ